MFSDNYGCRTCNDAGAVLVYHRTIPSGPWVFRCHSCSRGSMPRVKNYPTPNAQTMKTFAKWTMHEALTNYEKLRDEKEKKKP